MVKEAWLVLHSQISIMLNKCLSQKVFPKQSKIAKIRILKKGLDKPATEIKSYRPISSLLVLGKVLEKLFARMLKAVLYNHPLASNRQYELNSTKPGKFTENVIVKLRDIVSETNEKYTIGLVFDIFRTFDGV
ncbi:hypothetical protein M0802_013404 [Mischocyttarus mexicanus]|nr:hypothetical protein M0802_013404 [Mischocyttarus mexicanus]